MSDLPQWIVIAAHVVGALAAAVLCAIVVDRFRRNPKEDRRAMPKRGRVMTSGTTHWPLKEAIPPPYSVPVGVALGSCEAGEETKVVLATDSSLTLPKSYWRTVSWGGNAVAPQPVYFVAENLPKES